MEILHTHTRTPSFLPCHSAATQPRRFTFGRRRTASFLPAMWLYVFYWLVPLDVGFVLSSVLVVGLVLVPFLSVGLACCSPCFHLSLLFPFSSRPLLLFPAKLLLLLLCFWSRICTEDQPIHWRRGQHLTHMCLDLLFCACIVRRVIG